MSYRLVRAHATGVYQARVVYPPRVLIPVFLWAAVHGRPVPWACRPENWRTTRHRPPAVPSAPALSRRADGVGVGPAGRRVEAAVRSTGDPAPVDGKPLPVGGDSKGPGARFGRGAGCTAGGYELHAVWGTRPVPEAREIAPMSGCEKAAAGRLLGRLGHAGSLPGDGDYDAHWLYDAAAAAGYRLVSPRREAADPGGGHRYQSPGRKRSLGPPAAPFGRDLCRLRTGIGRRFGNAGSFGGGLAPAPAWARGADRVRTWVWARLLINAARILRE